MSKKKRLDRNKKKNASQEASSNIEQVETDVDGHKKDTSPYIWQREKINWTLGIRERYKWTERQQVIIDTMLHKDTRCVFIDASWGTGKSLLCVYAALKLLNSGRCKEIKYLRNPVEASRSCTVGTLPGTLEERLRPYMTPFYEKLEELLPKGDIDNLISDNRIECNAIGMIRGSSWNAQCIIVDEASALSREDLLLTISRCGEYSRIFIVSDSINQNDLGHMSGFRDMFDLFSDMDSKENGIFTFELREESDIMRSGFIKYVMKKAGVINTRSRPDLITPKSLLEREKERYIGAAESNEDWCPSAEK